jgi:hypothetical protein
MHRRNLSGNFFRKTACVPGGGFGQDAALNSRSTFTNTTASGSKASGKGDAGFTFLATDTGSPYVDNRPVKTAGQAEWHDYRACWWDDDEASLAFGPVLRVLVTG